MPEPKRPLKVFLCHAHADQDAVRALHTRLTNDGVDVWLDRKFLLGRIKSEEQYNWISYIIEIDKLIIGVV